MSAEDEKNERIHIHPVNPLFERDHEHDHEHGHSHEHDQSHEHNHEHGHSHIRGHRHQHTPEENKAVLDRLSRAIGHLESVRRMVVDGRDCSEVLIQLSAVRAALNKTGLLIIKNHMEHCIVEAVASGDMEIIDELNDAISKYFK